MTQPVDELEAKIKFLAKALDAAESELLGRHRSTVRSGYTANRINDDIERELAQKCCFEPSWPEWRKGTKADFEKRWTAWQECAAARLEPVPLKEDMFADTANMETPLASLSLRTGQSQNVAGEVSLGFDLNCPEDNACGQMTGVKRAFLIFGCGCGRTTDVKERTGYPAGETFNNARFMPHSVDANNPSWRVESADGCVIGLAGDVPPTFIRVFNLMPGSCVRAELKAYVKDIASAFVVPPDGKAQSDAKMKIKKRLRDMKISGGETGEAVLASAEIKFCVREA